VPERKPWYERSRFSLIRLFPSLLALLLSLSRSLSLSLSVD